MADHAEKNLRDMLVKLTGMCEDNDVYMELKVPNSYFHRLAGFFGRPIETKRHNFRDLPYFEMGRVEVIPGIGSQGRVRLKSDD